MLDEPPVLVERLRAAPTRLGYESAGVTVTIACARVERFDETAASLPGAVFAGAARP